jgi:hypothetical protein
MGKLIDIINIDNETNLLQTINLDVSNKTKHHDTGRKRRKNCKYSYKDLY